MKLPTKKRLNLEAKLRRSGVFEIAGADEAGRGPLAGPVVCAMVMFLKTPKIKGLDDSKKLTKENREKIFKIIIKKADSYAITIIPPEIIDKINISASIRFGFKECLKHMKPKPKIVLVDGNDKQTIKTNYINIIKGDQLVKCISASSILAKVTRDYLMTKYYSKKFPEYLFSQNKGYGTREHRNLIKKYGRCEIHRKSFKLKDEK